MMTIKGKHLRVVRLDAEGNPTGEPVEIMGATTGRMVTDGSCIEEVVREFPETATISHPFPDTFVIEMPVQEVDLAVVALLTGQTWMFNDMYMAMGAEYMFDYTGRCTPLAERLTCCYEYAAEAFVDYYFEREGVDKVDAMEFHNVPTPTTLVHGWYSSPETRDNPIQHAWVVLSDGRIWEPISSLIYDAQKFYEFTEPHDLVTYAEREVRVNMLKHGHYGPWHREES